MVPCRGIPHDFFGSVYVNCRIVACVLHGLHGKEDYTVWVVIPEWLANDADTYMTIVMYVVLVVPQTLPAFL